MQEYDPIIARLSAREYMEASNTHGRAGIPSELRQLACVLYDHANSVLQNEMSLSFQSRKTYQLIADVFAAEKYLADKDKPRYVHYTNMPLLDRFLLEGEAFSASEKLRASKKALSRIVLDWHSFEQDRLSAYQTDALPSDIIGYENPTGTGDRIKHLKERERTLKALTDFSAFGSLVDTQVVSADILKFSSDWAYFSADPERSLTHLLCLPRSKWHDEMMFLRMIHVTECCYAGVIAVLAPLPQFVIKNDWTSATELLKNGLFFSDFLIRFWTIFETMPYASFFDGFREATGDASAIQSLRFQVLDSLTRGLGDPKRNALSHQPEAGYIARWEPPKEATLQGLCELAGKSGGDALEFIEIAESLDKDLLKWRSRHLGIARKYLPKEAVGTGNEGVSYLEKNFREPLLRSKTNSAGALPTVEDVSDSEEAPVRATSIFRVQRTDSPPIAAVYGEEIDWANVRAAIDEGAQALSNDMRVREALIQRNLKGYGEYFRPRPFPVERQLQSFVKSRKLPDNVPPAFLLSLELKSGTLMGLHDATRISGQAVFDTASSDESFEGISGKDVKCLRGEPVIRDDKGIIASLFQGPDKRTAVQTDGNPIRKRWVVFVLGYSGMGMEAFKTAVADVEDVFGVIQATRRRTWIVHEY
ncbi:hypothetical protein MCEMSEM23_02219 [Rhabdaerophilaceae bacterium]